jgi:hypothetical protein
LPTLSSLQPRLPLTEIAPSPCATSAAKLILDVPARAWRGRHLRRVELEACALHGRRKVIPELGRVDQALERRTRHDAVTPARDALPHEPAIE